MAAAQRLAASRAIGQLSLLPDAAIVDGSWDFVSPHVDRVERVIKADARCLVVAAASILAKVSRGLGAPMTGIGMDEINQRYAERGW